MNEKNIESYDYAENQKKFSEQLNFLNDAHTKNQITSEVYERMYKDGYYDTVYPNEDLHDKKSNIEEIIKLLDEQGKSELKLKESNIDTAKDSQNNGEIVVEEM